MIPIIIDIEMSGMTPDIDHILEIAAVAVIGPGCHLIYQSHVQPNADFMASMAEDDEIMTGSTFVNAVSPITYQQLVDAPETDIVAGMFRDWLEFIREYWEEPLEFFAYNDSTKRQFLEYSPWDLGEESWGNDPMKQIGYEAIAHRYHGSTMPDRCLEGSLQMVGMEVLGPRHSALYDALNVTRLWEKIREIEAE